MTCHGLRVAAISLVTRIEVTRDSIGGGGPGVGVGAAQCTDVNIIVIAAIACTLIRRLPNAHVGPQSRPFMTATPTRGRHGTTIPLLDPDAAKQFRLSAEC